MATFDRRGALYLGRLYDLAKDAPRKEPCLYDTRDLTTHAVCVGMTGSGKTGLGIALLEEAALAGIPSLIVDPKGDLGDLLLTFPDLRPESFRPWVDETEAARQGLSIDDYAAEIARSWKQGLKAWGQDGDRIARLQASADAAIYTPGSSAGLPLSVLRSFGAPPPQIRDDAEALRERITATVSGILALLGIEGDPLRSREHILLSTLLESAWRQGRDLDLASLVRQIQSPPFDRIGVVDLESFFPAKGRGDLAMTMNGLLASPGFAGWREGEPLDIARLLFTPDGRPRMSILSIAHLPESERMFFVTILLNEVVAWTRAQPGTSNLRAVLYMDEFFGYVPPTANPPSKRPLLTLMKQARAFGLGVVLATQNPVDLDYKGLSNTGTWFLGRLQTERDKARVLEGLEGASAAAGGRFDRARIEGTLARLKSRVFLMNNVRQDEPVLFQTRFTLSYLRGPLTRTQIKILMGPRKAAIGARPAAESAAPPASAMVSPGGSMAAGRVKAAAARIAAAAARVASASVPGPPAAASDAPEGERTLLPSDVPEFFLPLRGQPSPGRSLLYRPALLGTARVHFASSRERIDQWEMVALLAPLRADAGEEPWDKAETVADAEPDLEKNPDPAGRFAPLPAAATRARSYEVWSRSLSDALYRTRVLTILACRGLDQSSSPGESEAAFRSRLAEPARRRRDEEIEAVRGRHASRIASLRESIRAAGERTEHERSAYQQQTLQTAISMGAAVLGALFGRKLGSTGNIGRGTTAARGLGRTLREPEDAGRAEDKVETLTQQLASLEAEIQAETANLQASGDPAAELALEKMNIRPKKSDITVSRVVLVWTPWRLAADGTAEPAFG